jgi:hypothetical protein
VFLGIETCIFGRHDFFETMIFGGPFDGAQMRYATWAEAEEGHARIVRLVVSPFLRLPAPS